MTTEEVLTKARSFIERGWTKNAIALDKDGNRVATNSKDATQWDIVGAIAAAEGWDAVKWNYESDIWLSVAKSLGLYDRKYDVPVRCSRDEKQQEHDTLIDAIHNQTPLENEFYQDVARRIMLDRLHKWHDAPERTKEEVLKALSA